MKLGNEDGLREAQICTASGKRVRELLSYNNHTEDVRRAETHLAVLGALALQLQIVGQVLNGAGLGGVLAAHHLRGAALA